jgi:hypothetical protein
LGFGVFIAIAVISVGISANIYDRWFRK